jgi:hypothetical protein
LIYGEQNSWKFALAHNKCNQNFAYMLYINEGYPCTYVLRLWHFGQSDLGKRQQSATARWCGVVAWRSERGAEDLARLPSINTLQEVLFSVAWRQAAPFEI